MSRLRPKIAVICAYNPANAGMYSVDLAASAYLSGRDCDFDLFVAHFRCDRAARIANRLRLYRLTRPQTTAHGMRYRLYFDPAQLSEYSHVVFWGDFTNNPVYGDRDFTNWDRRYTYSRSRPAAMARWKTLYALTGGKPAARVVSAGQNFQNDYHAYGQDFGDVFASLGAHFDHILPRDPHSLTNLSGMLGADAHARVEQGIDCAFLLDSDAAPADTGTFCYHFARSGFEDVDGLVRAVQAATGLRPVHLAEWFRLPDATADAAFTRMRQEMLGARFVLTDTYHVCVNALTLGVPTYCVGRAAAGQVGTLGDFKKKVLFDMMGAQAFHFAHDPETTEAAFFDHVTQAIGAGTHLAADVFGPVRDTVRQRTADFRARLDAILFD